MSEVGRDARAEDVLVHVAHQSPLTAVLKAESLDGAAEARRDDVVSAHTPAAEALAP